MSIFNSLEQGDLSHITSYQAGVIQAAMHRNLQKYCDAVLKPYGITKMQWLIIGSVFDSEEEGVRLTDLSKDLGTTMSYITSAVNLLESKGMLIRKSNDEDSRSKLISINNEFIPKIKEIEHVLRTALRQSIYRHIEPTDFRTYMKVMYQLSQVDAP